MPDTAILPSPHADSDDSQLQNLSGQPQLSEEWQFLAQLGAGADGISYLARNLGTKTVVEYRLLTSSRRQPFFRDRLAILELIDHPASTRVLQSQLGDVQPYITLEAPAEKSLFELLPLSAEQTRSVIQELTSVVACSHQMGLAHGRLHPDALEVREDGSLSVDFLGMDVGRIYGDDSCLAPEVTGTAIPDLSADVFSLGIILRWLIVSASQTGLDPDTTSTGETPGVPSLTAPDVRENDLFRLRAEKVLPSLGIESSLVQTVTELLTQCLSEDPTDRPSAQHLSAMLVFGNPSASTPDASAVSEWDQTGEIAREHIPSLSSDASNKIPPHREHAAEQTDAGIVPPQSTAEASRGPSVDSLKQLGRYRLLNKLGEGGMGAVFRGEDLATQEVVAIKILSQEVAKNPYLVSRFRKEARMLSLVQHPNVTRLLEINEDQGFHFLAMEFVAGVDLKAVIQNHKGLAEPLALQLIRDTARALAAAHERGIIHRDLKPANLLLTAGEELEAWQGSEAELVDTLLQHPTVKLTDFGLARQVEQTESMMLTQTGAFLGTPYYMAPEQCRGTGEVTPATDIYALGVTFFELLTGEVPFTADDRVQLIAAHCFNPIPSLHKKNPDLTDEVIRIVEKSLEKKPEDRYADASHLLEDLDRLMKGEPSPVELHPALPEQDPKKLFTVDFEWDLEANPAELWPYVSNTERINCAVGLPSVEYENRRNDAGELEKFGSFKLAGMKIAWQEHPFEWVEGKRLGILREFTHGPFVWFASLVELNERPEGGTHLKHSVRIEPRGMMGRMVANMEVKLKGKRSLEKVYQRIDATISGENHRSTFVDPFQKPEPLSKAQRSRLESRLFQLADHEVSVKLIQRFQQYLSQTPAQELSRIRPKSLAQLWQLPANEVLDACLWAAQCGLLVLNWDILCPTCRIASGVRDTLREIQTHERCEACDLDFELDFANSIELIFQVHPEIREADTATYCIGGPEHSPHVIAQLRLQPGERVDVPTALAAGEYVLRGPQCPYNVNLHVDPIEGTRRSSVELSADFNPQQVPVLLAGHQTLTITNSYSHAMLLRLERTIPRDDVTTAGELSTHSLFRELFPAESLDPGQLVNLSTVALLAIRLPDLNGLCQKIGDAKAFRVLSSFCEMFRRHLTSRQGTVVKAEHDRWLAAFPDALSGVEAALSVHTLADEVGVESGLLSAGLHQGAVLVTTSHDQLDYFGSTVQHTWNLTEVKKSGFLTMTEAITRDPQVIQSFQQQGLTPEIQSQPDPSGVPVRYSVLPLHALTDSY